MKYSLIYYDKWSSFVMGKYETYGEALLAMLRARKWVRLSTTKVRFEVREDQYHV